MDSSSPQLQDIPQAQPSSRWARPDDYDSEIESWFEDVPVPSKADKTNEAASPVPDTTTEAAPSKPDKEKSIAVEDSPYSPSHSSPCQRNSSDSEGAPEEGPSEFIITSPDSSPEPYEHPRIETWEEDVD